MSESRGHSLPESHLLPDAVVAFVDAELSPAAHERAAEHVAACPSCATDVSAQRQARTAVRGAQAPGMSAGFLANLRSIPEHTEVAAAPDNLAVTEDGQLVAVQRPERVAGIKTGSALGSSPPLGNSSNVLGNGGVAHLRRRTAQGAGVVVSGIVLSALALGVTGGMGEGNQPSSGGGTQPDVLRAQFNAPAPSGPREKTPAPSSTIRSSTSAAPSSSSSAVAPGQR